MQKEFYKYIKDKLNFRGNHCYCCEYIFNNCFRCPIFDEDLEHDNIDILRCEECIKFFGE